MYVKDIKSLLKLREVNYFIKMHSLPKKNNLQFQKKLNDLNKEDKEYVKDVFNVTK